MLRVHSVVLELIREVAPVAVVIGRRDSHCSIGSRVGAGVVDCAAAVGHRDASKTVILKVCWRALTSPSPVDGGVA
jgi:hypothetical protein